MLQKDPAKRLSSSNLKKNIEKLNNSIQIKNDLNGFINILENKNAEYSDDFISNAVCVGNIIELDRSALINIYSLENICNLTSIDLSNYRLKKIDKETFSGLVNLTSIELSRNQLQQINKRSLAYAQRIPYLIEQKKTQSYFNI